MRHARTWGVEARMNEQGHQVGVTAFFDMLSAPEVAYVHFKSTDVLAEGPYG